MCNFVHSYYKEKQQKKNIPMKKVLLLICMVMVSVSAFCQSKDLRADEMTRITAKKINPRVTVKPKMFTFADTQKNNDWDKWNWRNWKTNQTKISIYNMHVVLSESKQDKVFEITSITTELGVKGEYYSVDSYSLKGAGKNTEMYTLKILHHMDDKTSYILLTPTIAESYE